MEAKKMVRRQTLILVVLILTLQPFVVLSILPLGHYIPAKSTILRTMAQEPGSRLEPGEYTNHVPFTINGTADFETLGWPGSGLENDPYVIAGLNITADLGQVCIRVLQTNAYFVIRDCYLDQRSNIRGLELINTTHALIEYTTVISESHAIYWYNANNTVMSDSIAHSKNAIALDIWNSEHCIVEWNLLETSTTMIGRGLHVNYCPYFTTSHNEIRSGGLQFNYYILYSNHSSSSFDTVVGGAGYAADYCHFSSVSDIRIYGGSSGLDIWQSPGLNFARCSIGPVAGIGATMYRCHGTTVLDSSFVSLDGDGVYFSECNNTLFQGNLVDDTTGYGLWLSSCFLSELLMNTISNTQAEGVGIDNSPDLLIHDMSISDTGSYGLNLVDSNRPTLENLQIADIGDTCIYADTCHNGTLTDSTLDGSSGNGLYVFNSENWTITDNVMNNIGVTGIYLDSSVNTMVIGNQLYKLGSSGIFVGWSPDLEVLDNTVKKAASYGVYLTGCDRAQVNNNMITRCTNGIYADGMINCTFESNTISDSDYGVYISIVDNSLLHDNTLSDCSDSGIYVYDCEECNFTSNTMTYCGFYFEAGFPIFPIASYNHTFSENYINGLPFYYGLSLDGGLLDGDSYGQFLLVDCNGTIVEGGHFDRTSSAVMVYHSVNVSANSFTSLHNMYPLVAGNSPNMSIHNVAIHGVSQGYGMIFWESDYLEMIDCLVDGVRDAMWGSVSVIYSDLTAIRDCEFVNNYVGLLGIFSQNMTLSNLTITHNEIGGIMGWMSDYWNVTGCQITNSTAGISLQTAIGWRIHKNEIDHCSSYAIYSLDSTSDLTSVTENTLLSNGRGIEVTDGDYWTITNNTILWSSSYGIYLSGSDFTEVYYNIIALSGVQNGYDSRSGNFWDDGAVLGNWWDDCTPPAIYWVDGMGGNTDDRYPQLFLPTEPIIDSPLDVYYAEFSTGNEITWNPYDDNLRDWKVYIDGSLWDSDAWNYNDITVNIDGLDYGTYTAEVTVWDINQNTVTDTVLIHVFDGTPPTIDGPANTYAFVDGSGQTLVWEASDLHPDTYIVTLDDEDYETGSWTTGTIEANIDGLDVGQHEFVMTVYDVGGNGASDSVLVVVIDDDVAPTIDSPEDITYYVGTTENSIIWTPKDEYPARYELKLNDSLVKSGDWGGSRIVANIDGLKVGQHEFRITVYDGSGLSASDTVIVMVIAPPTTTAPALPLDYSILLIAALVGAGAIAVIVIVYLVIKRKRQ